MLMAVLTHILFVTFQFVCVPFAGRHRRPIAVERQSTHSSDD